MLVFYNDKVLSILCFSVNEHLERTREQFYQTCYHSNDPVPHVSKSKYCEIIFRSAKLVEIIIGELRIIL